MSEDVATDAQRAGGRAHQAPVPSALSRYGRFYAPGAMLCVAITGVPLFEQTPEREEIGRLGDFTSMWAEDTDESSLGIIVCLVLAGLLVAATFSRSRGFWLPLAIALWTVLPMVMLLAKLGYRDPKPDLSAMGSLGLGLMVALMLIAVAHTIHAVLVRRWPG